MNPHQLILTLADSVGGDGRLIFNTRGEAEAEAISLELGEADYTIVPLHAKAVRA